MRRLTRDLINSSIDAFVLALETINRPSVKYRMECFCFLFCNAWELLMKAKLHDEKKKIYYPKRRKQPRRSLSLDDCLNRIFTSEQDPVKLNIQRISELRNNAMHLVVPFVPPGIMGLFQAGVLNYPKALQDWFGFTISDRAPLGMMALIYDFDPKQHSLDYARMKRRLPIGTIDWLARFQRTVLDEFDSMGESGHSFYVPVEFELALVNKPGKADVVLTSGAAGRQALIMTVPKEPDKTHPYRQTEVVELLNQELGGSSAVNRHDLRCINTIYHVKSRPEFCYKSRFGPHQYSPQFIDWILRQAAKNPGFFTVAREKCKRPLRKPR